MGFGGFAGWTGFQPAWGAALGWMGRSDYMVWRDMQLLLGRMPVAIGLAQQRVMLINMLRRTHERSSRNELEQLVERMLKSSREIGAHDRGRVRDMVDEVTTTTTTLTSVNADQRNDTAQRFLAMLEAEGQDMSFAQAKKISDEIRAGKRDDFVRKNYEILKEYPIPTQTPQQTPQPAPTPASAPPQVQRALPAPPPRAPAYVPPPPRQQVQYQTPALPTHPPQAPVYAAPPPVQQVRYQAPVQPAPLTRAPVYAPPPPTSHVQYQQPTPQPQYAPVQQHVQHLPQQHLQSRSTVTTTTTTTSSSTGHSQGIPPHHVQTPQSQQVQCTPRPMPQQGQNLLPQQIPLPQTPQGQVPWSQLQSQPGTPQPQAPYQRALPAPAPPAAFNQIPQRPFVLQQPRSQSSAPAGVPRVPVAGYGQALQIQQAQQSQRQLPVRPAAGAPVQQQRPLPQQVRTPQPSPAIGSAATNSYFPPVQQIQRQQMQRTATAPSKPQAMTPGARPAVRTPSARTPAGTPTQQAPPRR